MKKMKFKLKDFLFIIALIGIVSCTNNPLKSNLLDNEKGLAQNETDSIVILKSLKNGLQGTWYNLNSKDDRSLLLFEIKKDTLFHISEKVKYRIIITKDSTFSMIEILSPSKRKTIKPRMSVPMKIDKLTEDSLIFWVWDYGHKKNIHYYKKPLIID